MKTTIRKKTLKTTKTKSPAEIEITVKFGDIIFLAKALVVASEVIKTQNNGNSLALVDDAQVFALDLLAKNKADLFFDDMPTGLKKEMKKSRILTKKNKTSG